MMGLPESYVGGLLANAVCIWFAFWAIRRKYDLDYPLDIRTQVVRWSLVSISFALTLPDGAEYKVLRVLAGIALLAFLVWPNLTYHLVRLVRRPHAIEKRP
jgi:hypothetical protein